MEKHSKILSVSKLKIKFKNSNSDAVNSISFELHQGEILGIVGESGSGKTITNLAVLNLLDNKSEVTAEQIHFNDSSLKKEDTNDSLLQSIRGAKISMIFQEPMSAFNPSMLLGKQVMEAFKIHNGTRANVKQTVLSMFEKVQLSDPDRIFSSYPHQVSGGQLQRVMIAMALINKPQILIADEPTTALDVTVQFEILALLKSLREEFALSIIFISHDLRIVSSFCERILVMKQGEIVESGRVNQVFNNPQHAYTKSLLQSAPNIYKEKLKDNTINWSDNEIVLSVKQVSKVFVVKKNWLGKPQETLKAANNINFHLRQGQILGLVGESGSGKSTLAKIVIGLYQDYSGEVLWKGQNIRQLLNKNRKDYYSEVQYIFQDPYSSLNPRMQIAKIIKEALVLANPDLNQSQLSDKAGSLLKEVDLDLDFLNRLPGQLSGGQRQRVVIARALALGPQLIICDECVSALDVSVQSKIIKLISRLREKYGISFLFISHDLAVVREICDEILIMYKGEIIEKVNAHDLLTQELQPYTQKLISSYLEPF